MFGKLLKYDFRSMFKQFAFIWPAALVLALVNHFTMSAMTTVSGDGALGTSTLGTTTAGITMLVYVAILMAMFITALIFAIQRFYKGILGDEGYLMHTLPVRPWQLIGSKLLTAVATTFLSVVVALLSILIIMPWSWDDIRVIFRALGYLFSHWDLTATQSSLALLESILLMLAFFATGFLQLYLSMGIGHLFSKHRVALSVAAFIAIEALITSLLNVIGPWLGRVIAPIASEPFDMWVYHRSVWSGIAVNLILSAVCFLATEYIIRKRLNLE